MKTLEKIHPGLKPLTFRRWISLYVNDVQLDNLSKASRGVPSPEGEGQDKGVWIKRNC